tara:strand:- start:454 stop:1107 length:654 start_codon:yes stop_codon:yes gene_type:complete
MKEFKIWKDISQLLIEAREAMTTQDEVEISIDQTIDTRGALREKVCVISEKITKKYNVKIAKYVTFALAVWIDEMMMESYEKVTHPWPALQKELYDTAEGGIEVYNYLDEILQNPFYPAFVYQFYYCMLKGGFKGKHVNDTQHTIQTYASKLEEVLNYSDNESDDDVELVHIPVVGKTKLASYVDVMKSKVSRYYGLFLLSGVLIFYGFISLILFVK